MKQTTFILTVYDGKIRNNTEIVFNKNEYEVHNRILGWLKDTPNKIIETSTRLKYVNIEFTTIYQFMLFLLSFQRYNFEIIQTSRIII